MNAIRILHAGDLHPRSDGTYAGKLIRDPQTGQSIALTDCRLSLEAMLSWEADNPCDLGILTGDLFDRANPSKEENDLISWFVYQLLERMPVVIIPGNHDMDVRSGSVTALHPLKRAAEALNHRTAPHRLSILVEQPTGELVQTGKGPVRVVGFPYPQKGQFVANVPEASTMSPEQILAEINARLACMLEQTLTTLHPTAPNIFLGHGSVRSAKIGVQPRSIDHDIFIPVEALALYDYVGLGHLHLHQQVAPNAWYSGSLLCQDFGEMHETKGWCVAEIAKGEVPQVTHIPNPHSRRFIDLPYTELLSHHPIPDGDVGPEAVYRIVGEVAEADEPEVCLAIARFEELHPLTQKAIEVTRLEDRARDAGMTTLLSDDEALERALQSLVPEERIPSILAKHRQMMEVPHAS